LANTFAFALPITPASIATSWRTLTFYQLGAVLHALVMKERIFIKDVSPVAALVEAVKSKVIVI
jgi:hypothetical protein